MKTWKYMYLFGQNIADLMKQAGEHGGNGWELVSVTESDEGWITMYFKR